MTLQAPSGAPRVLQVVLSLNPGGTERLVLELVTRLGPSMPTAVCCLDEAGDWAKRLEDQGIVVHALRRAPGFQPHLGRAIAEVAERHGATVIHAHHYSPFVYSCLARRRTHGVRLVYTEHGRVTDAPPSPKRRLVNRLYFARVPAHVFAVSDDLRRHMVQEGFPARRVGVIYNGIAVGDAAAAAARRRQRDALGVSDDAAVVGTIARLDPVKDLGTMLRAVADARRTRPVVALIVGDGPERAALETLAAQLDLTAHVRFLGHRDDARDWLAACDLFVNSSLSEGVSLTILEAMAASLPVAATAVGGTPEVVTPECGRLVPARSPAELARAILDIVGDPDTARRMGATARARVCAHFTIERMVQQYRDVYEGVA
jgi:glycosyltransferase involved in cell wall biosynthesis